MGEGNKAENSGMERPTSSRKACIDGFIYVGKILFFAVERDCCVERSLRVFIEGAGYRYKKRRKFACERIEGGMNEQVAGTIRDRVDVNDLHVFGCGCRR